MVVVVVVVVVVVAVALSLAVAVVDEVWQCGAATAAAPFGWGAAVAIAAEHVLGKMLHDERRVALRAGQRARRGGALVADELVASAR